MKSEQTRARALRRQLTATFYRKNKATFFVTAGAMLLLGGALLTETVFSWPGIGKYAVDCVLKSDFPAVQGIVILVAVIFVFMNLIVDIIYAYLDPRIKFGAKEEG